MPSAAGEEEGPNFQPFNNWVSIHWWSEMCCWSKVQACLQGRIRVLALLPKVSPTVSTCLSLSFINFSWCSVNWMILPNPMIHQAVSHLVLYYCCLAMFIHLSSLLQWNAQNPLFCASRAQCRNTNYFLAARHSHFFLSSFFALSSDLPRLWRQSLTKVHRNLTPWWYSARCSFL